MHSRIRNIHQRFCIKLKNLCHISNYCCIYMQVDTSKVNERLVQVRVRSLVLFIQSFYYLALFVKMTSFFAYKIHNQFSVISSVNCYIWVADSMLYSICFYLFIYRSILNKQLACTYPCQWLKLTRYKQIGAFFFFVF